MTPTEGRLYQRLLDGHGEPVSIKELASAVGYPNALPTDVSLIQTHLHNLRQHSPRKILSCYGRGWYIYPTPEEKSHAQSHS